MSAKPKPAEAVQLTSPSGVQVTVSAEAVDKFKGKGYRAAVAKASRPKRKSSK